MCGTRFGRCGGSFEDCFKKNNIGSQSKSGRRARSLYGFFLDIPVKFCEGLVAVGDNPQKTDSEGKDAQKIHTEKA